MCVNTESVSLIHKAECEDCGVTKQQSDEFLKEKEEKKEEEKKPEENVDDQDLVSFEPTPFISDRIL